jgi:PEP-CTERM motif
LGSLLGCFAGVSARAATLNYAFDAGTTFTFDDGGIGDLLGFFTINPPGHSFSGYDVVITGGQEAGTYTPDSNDNGEALAYTSASGAILGLDFAQNLNSAPQHLLLERVSWDNPPPGHHSSFTIRVAGGATLLEGRAAPVPEPSTSAMMLLGFVGLGFAASRRWGRPDLSNASA